MVQRKILSHHTMFRRRQLRLTIECILLALTGAGLIFLLVIDQYVKSIGRSQLHARQPERTAELPCWLIVPGAPYYPDGRPGLMLEDRLASAVALYRAGRISGILISGDGSEDYDEISVMQHYLITCGVAPDLIISDPAGYDTFETLVRARDVFHLRQAMITTQTYHLLRALYIGDRLGLQLKGVSCDSRSYPFFFWHRLREIIARFKAWLDCAIRRA